MGSRGFLISNHRDIILNYMSMLPIGILETMALATTITELSSEAETFET